MLQHATKVIARRSFGAAAATSQRHPVYNAFSAILQQQNVVLRGLSDDEYSFRCPTLHASTGGHVRHSLDHLRRSLALTDAHIRYDVRERNTLVEQNRTAAIDEVDAILAAATASRVDAAQLHQPVHAAFMLSAEGTQVDLASTVEREMAFAVHHAIHHNALIKVIISTHFPHVKLPPTFGVAPSTLNFQATHPTG
ncbi:Aste57867_25553 [Aphanomyces stellatus]|uniref:Aste57867_25553 protein n=1 Tax=Aphanomyces stellatus TaxID=120398 RepID=A0A485LUE6_9STRA|nr:hypothetical protein As57867_025474 [Aphanomyces stellatus]VFU02176.1 Aste57867_25553 [Aphanomyces stellatus]